jgi:biotin transport system ATP-binding protein
MIAAESLSFRHPGAEKDVLSALSFQVGRGELCCLLGVNGCGKSTLLRLAAGLYNASSGLLRVAGCTLPGKKTALRGKVALAPQDPDLYILGSLVEEDLFLGLASGEARNRALELAGSFGLDSCLREPVQTLSHGQKRKLCLASALAGLPELLLLEEPIAGLDYPGALAVRDILRRNKESGLTQLVAGHDLDFLADLADSFLLLQGGKLLCQGGAAEVFPLLEGAGVRPPLREVV